MRLFVALEIPAEVRKRLDALTAELRSIAPHFKWVRADNLHLTLKFIGEVKGNQLDAVRAVLGGIRMEADLELRYRGLGFFPSEKRPRVLWSGIDATPELTGLAARIDTELAKLGFPREERAFAPHLTLARLEEGTFPGPFHEALSKHVNEEFGSTHATEFHLIESKLKSTGAEYTTLQSFTLTPES